MFDLKKAQELYLTEQNITRACKKHCEELGIEYSEKYRNRLSRFLRHEKVEDENVEISDCTTTTKGYKTEATPKKVFSAIAPDGTVMEIEQFCEFYKLDFSKVKSYKYITNTGTPFYNIVFHEELVEPMVNEEELKEIIKKYIKPILSEKKGSVLNNNEWFDRLVYSDVHINMNVNGKDGDSLYEGKWDEEEVLKRLDLMIEHTKTFKKSNTLIITDLGDFLDGLSGQTTRKSHELPQNTNDKEAFELALKFKIKLVDSLVDDFDYITCNNITNDNHCFTPDVEVLTNEGFKFYKDINKDHLIATYNQETNFIEYQKPIDYIYNDIDSEIEIHNYKSKLMDLSVTSEHRMFVNRTNSLSDYEYVLSKNMSKVPMKFKCAGILNNKESDIEDNLIKLLAWLSTDGTVRKESKEYFIYQSKPNGISNIKQILDSLNCGYQLRKKSSNKETTHICGKQLKKKPLQMYEFVLNGAHTDKDFLNKLRDLMPTKDIPKIMFQSSKRQVDLFIETYVLGDGNIRKCSVNSATIYGTKYMLDKLQILCLSNGHRATLSVNNRGDNVLFLVYNRDFISFTYNNIEKVNIKPEFTWCLTLPNSNLFVRRNGRVSLQGNSGFFSYFVSSAVEKILTQRYPEKVKVNTMKRFINHYSIGKHTFVETHGKDIREMKFGFKPKLDAVQADKLDQYCKDYKLYNGNYIEVSKGDSHQALYDDATSSDFSYYNYPAFSPPSNWVKTNYTNSRSGFNFFNIHKEKNLKISIPYWFEKQ